MDQLIPIVSRLQEILQAIDPNQDYTIDLPRLVVVGAQSSGKSSVLETLVQRDFLPRGRDIVTRRPLILQLTRTNNSHNTKEDWVEFGHLPNTAFRNFERVREEIENETLRVAGSKKAISREPIFVRVYSSRVVDLTLIDLPGITKIPVGEQPPDIENQIRTLIMEYISKPNSIILAVTPANIDLVNSDALKMAREVDPFGQRTIGILTKLDLMDAGTNALDILMNKGDFRLKLGFIGLVMRSQMDINHNKKIEEALKAEHDFFRQNHQYKPVAEKCGSQYLAKELNKILLSHIKDQLPFIKKRINEIIVSTQKELFDYGDISNSLQNQQKGSLLLKLVTEYVSDFSEAIQGTFKTGILSQELIGGARLNVIFNEHFYKAMMQIDPIFNLSTEEVSNAIRNATGPKASLFVPEASFELLVKRQIKLFKEPVENCIQQSYEELLKVVITIEKRNLKRFPFLAKRIGEVSMELIRTCLAPCEMMVNNLLLMEDAYINTSHPDFWKNNQLLQSLTKVVEEKKKKETSNNFNSTKLSASDEISTNPIEISLSSKSSPSNYHDNHGGGGSGSGSSSIFSYLFPTHHNHNNKHHYNSTTKEKDKKIAAIPPTNTNTTSAIVSKSSTKDNAPSFTFSTSENLVESQFILNLIQSYFQIVRKNLLDLVPKAIMHFLVNQVLDQLPAQLVSELYKEDLLHDLLKEDEHVVEQREKCKKALEAYRQASEMLGNVFE